MLKRLLGVLVACAALSVAAWSEVIISVNAKDGDVISGDYKFQVKVTSKNLVTQVEFYVGDDLRGADESTPYEFPVDTINEKEGEFKITFAAYTSEGESAKKSLTLKIDNGLEKGLDFFIQQGKDSLTNSKWDDAIKSARVALKVKPGDAGARIVLARANYGKGVYDAAQKYVDDVLTEDPKNIEALGLMSSISLRRAFLTVNTAMDPAAALANVQSAIESAVKSRRTTIDSSIEKFGAVNDANLLNYVDLLIVAGRYSLAAERLAPAFRKDQKNTEIANRLAYSLIRACRVREAADVLRNYEKYGQMDGYGYGLKAMLLQYRGDTANSMEAEKQAILNDPANLGVRMAQTYLALVRESKSTLKDLSANLARDAGDRTETSYYLSAAYHLQNKPSESRLAFQTCLLAEPTNFDMFVEAGNQALLRSFGTDIKDREAEIKLHRNYAKKFFEAAILAKPESFQAMAGLALVRQYLGEKDEALKVAQAAAAAAPEYAAGHYVLAAILSKAGKPDAANAAMKKAEEADPATLGGRMIPTIDTAREYFYRNGRIPLIVPPSVKR